MDSTRVPVIEVSKFISLLLLGTACMAVSMTLLLSISVAMPVLTEQVRTWLQSSQWNAAPLSMSLAKMGLVPHRDPTLIAKVVDWLLSFETGFAIIAAVALYGLILWIFEIALREWGPSRPASPQSGVSPRKISGTQVQSIGLGVAKRFM